MALSRKDLRIGFVAAAALLVLGVAYVLVLALSGPGDALAALDEQPGVLDVDPAPQVEVDYSAEHLAVTDTAPGTGNLARQDTAPRTGDDWAISFGLTTEAGPRVTQTPDRNNPTATPTAPPAPANPTLPIPPELSVEALTTTDDDRVHEPEDVEQQGGGSVDVAAREAQIPGLMAMGGRLGSIQTSDTRNAVAPYPPQPGASALPTLHVIRAGDNFSSLAEHYYGDPSLFFAIRDANSELDPRRLKVGAEVMIPVRPASKVPPVAPEAQRAAGANEHIVGPGETLSIIASRRLGRAALWQDIYELNRDTIGSDPARLKVGMVLRLPQ